jgi:tRNA pseudouridine55 synthase
VVDKPRGATSHDVVDEARRWLGTRRVGHLGTLDPLATGVLPLAVREATKLVPFLEPGGKTYVGSIRLGEETDTLDGEGRVVRSHHGPLPEEAAVRAALAEFTGEIEQVPPMFSAVKLGGVPLHRMAREGRQVERAPKRVRIDRLDLVEYAPPEVGIRVDCSPGTYVRALAADLGSRLGCGAYLAALRRTRSGAFDIAQAATTEELAAESERGAIAEWLIPPLQALPLPPLHLGEEEALRVMQGGEIRASGSPAPVPGARLAAVGPGGELIAILQARPGRILRPIRVLRSLAPAG